MIVSGRPRTFAYMNPESWDIYRNTPAWEFARFMALAEKGQPSPAAAADPALSREARNLADVEASLTWTQEAIARL